MASVTLNQELDSAFLKGLRLLHSSEPDAEEQLQQLWKQSVIDKYGSERTPISVLHKITIPSALKRENQDTTNEPVVEAKRPKLENSVFSKPTASASPQKNVPVDVETINSNVNEDSDSDPPLQILHTDGICSKCKTSNSSNNNKLVECVDCHKHYHQLCHFPPITDMDLNDPRFVWYCSSCDQSITTIASDKTKTSSSSSVGNVKSGNSKVAAKTKKSGRLHSTNNSKASVQGNSGSTSSKSSDSSSKESSNSSKSPEKKGSHMMKKRSMMKKPDKKKSTK